MVADQKHAAISKALDGIAADRDVCGGHPGIVIAKQNAEVQADPFRGYRWWIDAQIARDFPIVKAVEVDTLARDTGEFVPGING